MTEGIMRGDKELFMVLLVRVEAISRSFRYIKRASFSSCGRKRSKEAMDGIETQLQRLLHLNKWFVDIVCPSPAIWDS